jgi:acetolactate synthase I/II/III large subunit
MIKLSDYVIDFIVKQGVSHIFELIGGMITHLIDSTYERTDIQCVSVHHEQAGAFAAEGYARINCKLGVAMGTSGPGALNLLTGIGSCYFDSVPCLFITGQVNTYDYRFNNPSRQIGFQETDIISIAKPLTKYAAMVIDAKKIRYHLEKAVYLAQNGRPGPVLLDIPMNIQRSQINPKKLVSFFDSKEYKKLQHITGCNEQQLAKAETLIAAAKRPVILAGGGIRTANATLELEHLIKKTGIPVVTSLMGLDTISHDNPAFFGMIGTYGNRYSNLTLANSDLLMILGSRLDSRQTGTNPETFARAAKKIHVDIDPNELNTKVKTDLPINCNIKTFLTALNKRLSKYAKSDFSAWYNVIDGYRMKYPNRSTKTKPGSVDPNRFMEILSARCSEKDIICLDVGQNQMWAAQSFHLKKGQRMLISGGLGAMGFSLPAALGATKASPDKKAIVISGDGGIQINIQDLDTIVTHHLPVKIFVMNNGCLGMVRQFQDMYFAGRHQSTILGYNCPNLIKIASAYGIPSYTIDNFKNAEEIIELALTDNNPVFVEVKLEQSTCVNPKLLVNRPLEDMSPFIKRTRLKKEMLIELADEKEPPKHAE